MSHGWRTMAPHQGLKIVSTSAGEKGGYCDGGRVACQFASRKTAAPTTSPGESSQQPAPGISGAWSMPTLGPNPKGICHVRQGNAVVFNGWGARITRAWALAPSGPSLAALRRSNAQTDARLSNPRFSSLSPNALRCYVGDNVVPSYGWGARIRTWECRHQKPVPYRLATPQVIVDSCSGYNSCGIRRALVMPIDGWCSQHFLQG